MRHTKGRSYIARIVAPAAAVFLAACTAGSAGSSDGTSGQVVAPLEQRGELAGRPAPDFVLDVYGGAQALGGEHVRLSDIAGKGKPVVLNFWAALCPPCRAEMPDFQKASEEHGDDVTIVGLDVGPFIGLGSIQQGRNLVGELNIRYPTGSTTDSTVVSQYRVLGMPTTVFIDREGTIVQVHTGILDQRMLADRMASLLVS